MSLIIVHLGREAVHLVTDTAAISADGVMGHFQSKVFLVPHLSMAIAVRGYSLALPIAAMHLQASGASFDEVFDRAPTTLRAIFVRQPDPALAGFLEGAGAKQDVEITVVGISKTRGPIARQLVVTQNGGKLEWATSEIGEVDAMFGPFTPDIAEEFEQRIETARSSRLAELGWLADRARRIKSPVFGRGKDMHQIGGHAVLAKISASGIETKIIRRWNDEIGKPIDPGSSIGGSQRLPMGGRILGGQLDLQMLAKAT